MVPAVAFVMDSYGQDYFNTFKQLWAFDRSGFLQVNQTEVLRPPVFETMLDLMLSRHNKIKHFVIWCHGAEDGLEMALTRDNLKHVDDEGAPVIQARDATLDLVMQMADVKDEVRRLDEALKRAGQDQKQRDAVLAGWEKLSQSVNPTQPVADIAQGKANVRSWLAASARALELTETRVDQLIDKMKKVRTQGLGVIEIRACLMGKSRTALQTFRRFFGADVVGAPRLLSSFGEVVLQGNLDPAGFDSFLFQHPFARRFGEAEGIQNGGFALEVIYHNTSPTTVSTKVDYFCAATSPEAVQQWAEKYLLGTLTKSRVQNFPIHFMTTTPEAFQAEPAYWHQMTYAVVTDSDA